MKFQSTRPRGARPGWPRTATRWTCFNPRAREGRDQGLNELLVFVHMFQSTRPRGARLESDRVDGERIVVSIHAPARGATPATVPNAAPPSSFNPRAREGRDSQPRALPGPPACFNPRAREGRDQSSRVCSTPPMSFNPRAREGRDYRLPKTTRKG